MSQPRQCPLQPLALERRTSGARVGLPSGIIKPIGLFPSKFHQVAIWLPAAFIPHIYSGIILHRYTIKGRILRRSYTHKE